MIGRLASRLVAAVVFLIASFGVACGGDSEPETTGSEGTVTAEASQSEPVSATPTARSLPDISVDPVAKCELAPSGSLSGGDVVNLYVPMSNVGNAVLDSLVRVRAEGSSGLAGSAFFDGKESSVVVRVVITGQEYGQQQRFTIIADPEDAITELDKSNNETTVLVDFPPYPPSTPTNLNCRSPAP